MQLHEELFYDFQTEARGLLTESDLIKSFESRISVYDQLLLRFLPHNKESSIVDIPCGFGAFLFYLKSRGYTNIVGYDLDPKQVELANLLGLPAHSGDAFEVAREDNSLDMIASIDFLEHITKDQACMFLQSCIKSLKPEGILIMRVPSADGPFGTSHAWNDITHKWFLTSTAWKRGVLRMVGFEEKNIEIIEDRIPPSGYVKKIMYKLLNYATIKYWGMMSVAPPQIWSRSMWIVCRK
ncbi:MAG: class I SAM-dependent methyltransferase [Candidatus Methanogaster sp.]|uniref:Class I SAM-dependent methyltransferase n=1 Tax=Candidatus Methanogaster sp. TaxID=3386292 RepID=A0AC61L4X5_9EURY|nr:MAG: class I SAM-dependent methyltransferase [ANME-2 cluster archaeon]